MARPGLIRTIGSNFLEDRSFMAKSTGCLLLFFAAAFGSGAALGKVAPPSEKILSVITRTNPLSDPNGARVGDFIFSPSLTLSELYDDNIFARNTDIESDLITKIIPSLAIRSDFIRHAIGLTLRAEDARYRDNGEEDYTDYSARINGEVDVTGQTTMPFSLSFQRDHYDRGDPDETSTLDPTVFDIWDATLGLLHQGQTLTLRIIGGIKRYLFQGGRTLGGFITNADRDRDERTLYMSVGLSEDAILAPYIYSELTDITYQSGRDDAGFARGSSGYEAGVGAIINFSDVTRASFNIGYVDREYNDPRLSGIGDFAYGLNLIWQPSTLAAFTLEGKRTIEETTTPGASGRLSSTLRLSMDYELFPNLMVKPSISYRERETEGTNSLVKRVNAGLDLTYKMNQNVWLSTTYQYIDQKEKGSDEPTPDDYKSNVYGLSVKLQF
jgi:hypothetical protein